MVVVEARLTFEYTKAGVAADVARLLQVDNEIAPRNLEVQTTAENNHVITKIKSNRGKTVFATLDDVVFSEKLISEILNI